MGCATFSAQLHLSSIINIAGGGSSRGGTLLLHLLQGACHHPFINMEIPWRTVLLIFKEHYSLAASMTPPSSGPPSFPQFTSTSVILVHIYIASFSHHHHAVLSVENLSPSKTKNSSRLFPIMYLSLLTW